MDCYVSENPEEPQCDHVTVKIEHDGDDEQPSCAPFGVLRMKPDISHLSSHVPDICSITMEPAHLDIPVQTESAKQTSHYLEKNNTQSRKNNNNCVNNYKPSKDPLKLKSSISKLKRITLKRSLTKGNLDHMPNKRRTKDKDGNLEPIKSKGKSSSNQPTPKRSQPIMYKRLNDHNMKVKILCKSKRSLQQSKCAKEPTQPQTNNDAEGFKCDMCNKEFKTAGHLTRHIRVHSGERPFQCSECEKSYKDSSVLLRHQIIHSQERRYECTVCPKTFIQSKDLQNHQRVHTGDRPYPCETCNKNFSSASYLAVHVRTHTGEKPFICKICHQSFTGSTTLSRHHRTHTGEKRYQCSLCSKAFTRPATLKNHQKNCPGQCDHTSNSDSQCTSSPGVEHTTTKQPRTRSTRLKQ